MALIADIRFDSRPSNRIETFFTGGDIIAFAHFRDAETRAYVDVSGVSAVAYQPGGAVLSPAPTLSEISPGIWRMTIAAQYADLVGTWRLQASCSSPSSIVAVRDFALAASSPSAETAPPATSRGPFEVGTPGGTASAIVGTLSAAPLAGARVALTMPVTSGAAPVTLTLTVGTTTLAAVQMRQADGTQPVTGLWRQGETLDLHYTGTFWRVLGVVDDEEIERATIHRMRWRVPGDAQPRLTLEADTDDGRILLRTGGDGTTLPDYTVEIEEDGSLRTLGGKIKTRRGVEVLTEDNPPDIADDLAHVLAQIPMPLGRDNRDVVAVDQTQPYVVSTERYLRVVQANTPLNFIGLQVNWDCVVEVQAAASAVAIAPPGMTWRSTASATQLALAAGSYLVQRTQTQIYCTQRPDFTTTSAAAAPSYARKAALLPAQSWGVHGEQDLWRAFQAELSRLSAIEVAAGRSAIDPSVFPIQGIARGASPLQQSNDDSDHTEDDEDTANYHWWKTNNTAGPLLTDALAVLADATATGPGSLSALLCLSFLGISDGLINSTGVGMDDTGDCTIATWSSAHLALQAATRTALSLPSLRWFMVGLPNQPEAVFTAGSLTAIRQAQLAVVAGDADTHRGAETWDLWRWDAKRHLTYEAQALLGLRLARAVAAVAHGVNTYRGPKIVGAERASGDVKRLDVTIRRNPTSVSGTIALIRPIAPVGFGIIPAGAGVVRATRYTIKHFGWATSGSDDVLQITCAEDLDATPQLLFPDGFCVNARHRSRVISGNDGVTLMPLQSHRIGDYTT